MGREVESGGLWIDKTRRFAPSAAEPDASRLIWKRFVNPFIGTTAVPRTTGSWNNLAELDESLTASSDISMLNISENPLLRLPVKIFEKLRHLKQFDVSNTQITSLPRIPSTIQLNELTLDGIALRCDCEMIWMVNYFSQFSTHISASSQIKCAMPSKYAGTPITLFSAPECVDTATENPTRDPKAESLCQSWACNHGAKCIVQNDKPIVTYRVRH